MSIRPRGSRSRVRGEEVVGFAHYSEATAVARVAEVPLAHLSIEVGHLYMSDLQDAASIESHFRRVAPIVQALTGIAQGLSVPPGARPRISTCFLIDDYFHNEPGPQHVVPMLLRIALECGVRIDYLALESGCARFRRDQDAERPIPLAQMVADSIVAEPAPGSTGRRPPTAELGWLCNGSRSSDHEPESALTMNYRPPVEFTARDHSVFLDVELWSHRPPDAERQWSCPLLASVWQLLRLGMLRHEGKALVQTDFRSAEEPWPTSWDQLPSVLQVQSYPAPFAAFHALSILPQQYLSVEHAVDVILEHVALDRDVVASIQDRAQHEAIALTGELTDRLSHYFMSPR
ncbi:SCO2522 family protein [Nocardia sp. NPDC055053]